MMEINRYFTFGPRQIIFDLNKFIGEQTKKVPIKNQIFPMRPNSKDKSPMRIAPDKRNSSSTNTKRDSSLSQQQAVRNVSSSPNRNKLIVQGNEPSAHSEAQDELNQDELGTNENVYHCQKEQRHNSRITTSSRVSLLGNKERMLLPKSKETGFKYFSDLALQSSLIYYATSEFQTNGVIFTPKQYDLNSNLFIRVFYNFTKAAFKIKKMLDHVERFQVI